MDWVWWLKITPSEHKRELLSVMRAALTRESARAEAEENNPSVERTAYPDLEEIDSAVEMLLKKRSHWTDTTGSRVTSLAHFVSLHLRSILPTAATAASRLRWQRRAMMPTISPGGRWSSSFATLDEANHRKQPGHGVATRSFRSSGRVKRR